MNRHVAAMVIGPFLFACGGTATETKKTPPPAAEQPESDQPTSQGGLTPEQIDAVDAVFRRKAGGLQHCWQDEYDRTDDKATMRKVAGDVTVALSIQPSGKPAAVKVLTTTLNQPGMEKCVVEDIGKWVFPELPQKFPYRRSVHLGAQF